LQNKTYIYQTITEIIDATGDGKDNALLFPFSVVLTPFKPDI